MTSPPLLDTHIWVWWMHGDPRLSNELLDQLDGMPEDRRPIISDISLWEVATLVSLGRLQLGTTLDAWFQIAANRKTVKVWPITASIAAEVARLPESFHRDPADRLIVATSRVLGAPLVTHDDRIVNSGLTRLWGTRSKPRALSFRERLPRLFELIESVSEPEHADSYFREFEQSLALPTGKLDAMTKLESQLALLDGGAWADLRPRAAREAIAKAPRGSGRGWQEMFDVFSEARAYGYLRAIGASDIEFIPRSDFEKRPDLKAMTRTTPVLCEVKTINISEIQSGRNVQRAAGEITVADAQIEIGDGLLNKIDRSIQDAIQQLEAQDPSKKSRWLVFVALNFDDFLNQFIDRYVAQIDGHLAEHPYPEVDLVLAPRSNPFDRTLSMRNAAIYLE